MSTGKRARRQEVTPDMGNADRTPQAREQADTGLEQTPDRNPRVTIIVPCYNEERRLDTEAFRSFRVERYGVRFLFVNDGSTDATGRILDDLVASDTARFDVLHLARNSGKAEAVRRGMLQTFAGDVDYAGYWDADLATPLDAIRDFCGILDHMRSIEVVFGARVNLLGRQIERSRARHYLGRVFATVAAGTLGLQIYDTQCGAKLFRVSDEWRRLFAEPFVTNWVFDVEIVARFVNARHGTSLTPVADAIFEYPLRVWRDVAGSKVKVWDFFRAVADMMRIRNRYPSRRR